MPATANAPLTASKRNNRVLVQRLRQSALVDASGHLDESNSANWEPANNVGTIGKIWAQIMTPNSREYERLEQVTGDISHVVNCAYQDGKNITEKMRLVFRGRILNISAPPENIDENNHSLVFSCIEVVEGK